MKGFLLDIDGTTLLGPEPLPGSLAFVQWLRDRGLPHLWLTNNTSRSREGWLGRLANAGLEPRADELYTAGDATTDWLQTLSPSPRVHLVGTRELEDDFRRAGVQLVSASGDPQLLVLGYDTELTYQKIQDAALLLRQGIEYVATHPDLNCPTPRGLVPDVGAFMALFETACGRTPRVIGKPHAAMVEGALGRLGVEARDVVMVGDRLATDVLMAKEAGLRAFLVLSGVTKREDVAASDVQPDEVFESLADVHAYMRVESGV